MNLDQAIVPELSINEAIALYACRSYLGRRSYAVGDCVAYLVEHWAELPPRLQRQIHAELRVAIELDQAGDACDVAQWQQVLALPLEGGGV
jgi:hypothetical protein